MGIREPPAAEPPRGERGARGHQVTRRSCYLEDRRSPRHRDKRAMIGVCCATDVVCHTSIAASLIVALLTVQSGAVVAKLAYWRAAVTTVEQYPACR